jgi:hypothetical protein
VDLKPFFGQSNIVIKDHPALLLDVPIVQRLTFPDAVFPGQSRNDIVSSSWLLVMAPISTTQTCSFFQSSTSSYGPVTSNRHRARYVSDGI